MNRRIYFGEGLTAEDRKRAKEELGETEEVRNRTLNELRKLITEEPDFEPNTEDAFLLRYLRARKFNVQKAFKTLKNYYQYKARYSKILTDFTPSQLKDILELGQCVALDYRNPDDIGFGVLRVGQYDIDRFTPYDVLALALMLAEIGLTPEVTQVVGYSVIIDFAGFNMRMAKHYGSPTYLYRFIAAVQDCTPCRIKAYHIINEPTYFNVLYAIVKNFLSEKLKKRVFFHGKNMESLHKHIVPDILPEEFGGTYGPISKIAEHYVPKIKGYEDHFIRINKFGYVGETLKRLREEIAIEERT